MTRGRDQWRRLISAFEKSKGSLEEFCAREGVNARTFRWWRWRLGASCAAAERATTSMQLVEVGLRPSLLAEPARPNVVVEIILEQSGLAVHVCEGANTRYIAELVAELRDRC